ncbi:MAG: nucleotidyl transferase AbiEii/AbiGii toxin family protein [Eubacteriales bacterium]|nr:nucleotidyl transferase AbiEii/AbiGii toxin family protein [Eubacteriales bacterium]
MNITAEEKMMYKVMKAIYDSGIPISFKGSMVLKACLMEYGFSEDTRHTVDIDANWNSNTPPIKEQMTESLQSALKKSDINLDVTIYRMYGERCSAGFELADKTTGEILFSMDIDVNRPISPTKIYEVDGLRFRGVAPIQMIADKVSVVSTDKVFRRIKDVVDLYYISKVFDFPKSEIMKYLNNSGRSLDTFNGFLHRTEELRHSYNKFRFDGNVSKPPFDKIYSVVKAYLKELLPKEKRNHYKESDYER